MRKPKFEVNEIVILKENELPYRICQVNADCTYRLKTNDTTHPNYSDGSIGCFAENDLHDPIDYVFETFEDGSIVIIQKQVGLKWRIVSLFVESQKWDLGESSYFDGDAEKRLEKFKLELDKLL